MRTRPSRSCANAGRPPSTNAPDARPAKAGSPATSTPPRASAPSSRCAAKGPLPTTRVPRPGQPDRAGRRGSAGRRAAERRPGASGSGEAGRTFAILSLTSSQDPREHAGRARRPPRGKLGNYCTSTAKSACYCRTSDATPHCSPTCACQHGHEAAALSRAPSPRTSFAKERDITRRSRAHGKRPTSSTRSSTARSIAGIRARAARAGLANMDKFKGTITQLLAKQGGVKIVAYRRFEVGCRSPAEPVPPRGPSCGPFFCCPQVPRITTCPTAPAEPDGEMVRFAERLSLSRSAFSRKNPPPCVPPWQGGTAGQRGQRSRKCSFAETGTEARGEATDDGATKPRSDKGRTNGSFCRGAVSSQQSAFKPELTRQPTAAQRVVLQKGCPLSAISFQPEEPTPLWAPLGKGGRPVAHAPGSGRECKRPHWRTSRQWHTSANGFVLRCVHVSPQRDDGAGLSKNAAPGARMRAGHRHPYRSR